MGAKIKIKAVKIGPWWKFWRKYKWRLDRGYVHQTTIQGYSINCGYVVLWPNGSLHIRKGYCWDGASGPTWDTESCKRGALVHDSLYQIMRECGLPLSFKDYADGLLRKICLEDGMSKFRAWYWLKGVQLFGGKRLKK